MQFSIANLGPIKKGFINIDASLLILTGPNNTGKSYLTYLIHGLSKYRELGNYPVIVNRLSGLYNNLKLFKQNTFEEINIDIYKEMKLRESAVSKIINDVINNSFAKIFASSSISPDISIDLKGFSEYANGGHYKYVQIKNNRLVAILQDESETDSDTKTITTMNNEFSEPQDKLVNILGLITSVCLNKEVNVDSYFFPAERTAINMFAKHLTSTKAEIKDELDTEVISGLSDEELGRHLRTQVRAAPKYPYAIRDYINFVNNFKPDEKEGKYASIANKMEITLAGGKVHLDSFEQLVFTPKDSKIPLALHLSSSLIKSLSYLILYLRYKAKDGDKIIIDEPELNLHPDLQIALAKTIAEMVNAGLKVVISTHSDYLIKELNNLILLNELSKFDEHKEFIAKRGFGSEHLLEREEVAAYFLDGESVIPINLKENGIEVSTINDAMTQVDSLAGEVYFRLQEATSVE